MRRMAIWSLLLIGLACSSRVFGNDYYVPDEKTAIKIADAVLVARFGEDKVNSWRPLVVDNMNKKFWIITGQPREETLGKGGGIAVWINRQNGQLQILLNK